LKKTQSKRRKLREPAPFKKKWSVQEKESILDYLHGDLEQDEVKACCYYEYARESETLRKARQEYDPAGPENSSLRISNYFPAWVHSQSCFWQCNNFPDSAWRDLTQEEREDLRLLFKRISPWPIITDVRMLDARRIFDDFKQQAEELRAQAEQAARTAEKSKVQVSRCSAIVGEGEIKHVVITVDYRDGPAVVTEQFARWLNSNANEKLFEKYHKKLIHKQNPDSPDRDKELLKFLAAWRLYDQFRHKLGDKLSLKAAKDWTRDNRRRETERLKLRAFFKEKPSNVVGKDRQFFGPLYSERRDWEHAVAKAKDFLAREIECGQPGGHAST
jgi:hypothetical protein